MCEVRNKDGKLVCRIDESTETVEIKVKNCITLIRRKSDGTPEIKNLKVSN